MQAHRVVVETDDDGKIRNLPALPPRVRVEAIFLVLEEPAERPVRVPPPELSGLRIQGDVVAPALDEGDWKLGGA